MPRYASLFLSLSAALTAATVHAEPSAECVAETRALQNSSFLDLVQNDLYDQYQDDYNSVCDFTGLSVPDCGLKFEGNNRTYVAACEDKGGQVVARPVKLRCGYSLATVDLGLGEVPTCVGSSCNASELQAGELMDGRVQEFFNNLSFTGCSADYSAAVTTTTGSLLGAAMVATAGLLGWI